eukprot:790219-Rhodomonas_salina.1
MSLFSKPPIMVELTRIWQGGEGRRTRTKLEDCKDESRGCIHALRQYPSTLSSNLLCVSVPCPRSRSAITLHSRPTYIPAEHSIHTSRADRLPGSVSIFQGYPLNRLKWGSRGRRCFGSGCLPKPRGHHHPSSPVLNPNLKMPDFTSEMQQKSLNSRASNGTDAAQVAAHPFNACSPLVGD